MSATIRKGSVRINIIDNQKIPARPPNNINEFTLDELWKALNLYKVAIRRYGDRSKQAAYTGIQLYACARTCFKGSEV